MFAKASLTAICALSASYYLLQSGKPPISISSAPLADTMPHRQGPLRVPFDPPTRKPVARLLQKGTVHVYSLPLKAGEFVTIIAFQDGVDLKVAALGTDGKPFLIVDSPTGTMGPERLSFVTGKDTTYSLEVAGVSDLAAGPYRIWIATDRRATSKDRKDAEAEILFFHAKEKGSSSEEELKASADLWRKTRNHARLADALRCLGDLYNSRSEWKKALLVWQQAKPLYHRVRDFAFEGKIDALIGSLYMDHSQIELAEKSFQQELLQGQRSKNRKVIAGALYSLGIVLRMQGRSVEALERLEQARATATRGIDPPLEVKALTAIGEVLSDAGNTRKAKAVFQEALRAVKNLERPEIRAFVWTGIAKLYSKNHEQALARHFYEEALRIQRQINSVNGMSTSLNGLAWTFLNDKRPQDALGPFQRALDLVKNEDNPLAEASVLTNLGGTYSLLKREKDARSAYERALALAKGKDAQMEAAALLGLARLEVERGNPIAAQKQAEAAVRCVEGMRAVVGRDLQISFFATRQDVYDTLIEILLWEDRIHPSSGFDEQALRVSEQARSRSLLDRVSQVNSGPGTGGAGFAIPSILSLPDIQSSVLDSDTLLLEYHLGNPASYLWVVGNNFHQVCQLPSRQRIEDLVSKLSRLIAVRGPQEKLYQARQVAEELSRILIGPAAYWLGHKRLAISSPAVLQTVPFGILPDPQGLSTPAGFGQWSTPLILGHEIVRIPSASVIAAIRARASGRTPPPNRLAVLYDPVSDNHDERLAGHLSSLAQTRSGSAVDALYGRFDRLDHAKDEASAILSVAGSRGVWSASGFDVTRELVLSGRLSIFRNIHFSMHGYFAEKDGNRSSLVLSLWDRHRQYRDGFLRASDIYGLKLPADLVVLSACNTGRGESVPGEGVVGLPQAFLVAGATQVMMSLWPIDDLATSLLMKDFYAEYLKRGVSPALALRNAQKTMLQSEARGAPFYWGGFEIQGDWNPTSVRR